MILIHTSFIGPLRLTTFTMPPTTPSSRNRTRQQPHPQDPPSPRHFIGRIDRSPFIFNTDQPLTETDRRWLRTGSIDEAQYDTDYNARDGFISDKKAEGSARVDVVVDLTSDEAGDSPSPASPSETSSTSAKSAWTRKQEVFLWKAQVRTITWKVADVIAAIWRGQRMGKGGRHCQQGGSRA